MAKVNWWKWAQVIASAIFQKKMEDGGKNNG
jgi:hypothetical protein